MAKRFTETSNPKCLSTPDATPSRTVVNILLQVENQALGH